MVFPLKRIASLPERVANDLAPSWNPSPPVYPPSSFVQLTRPPRARSLAVSLLQGDALRADARKFLSIRALDLPKSGVWTPEAILAVEKALEVLPEWRPGGFLGMLRIACDLAGADRTGQTWHELSLFRLLRRRVSQSSGLVLTRNVQVSQDLMTSIIEEPALERRRDLADLLRLLGARMGGRLLAQPRLIEKSLWEFVQLVIMRAESWRRLHTTPQRRISYADFYWAARFALAEEGVPEGFLLDLRRHALQTGSPLARRVDSYIHDLQRHPGSGALLSWAEVRGLDSSPEDPRQVVWQVGQSLSVPELGIEQRRSAFDRADRFLQMFAWKLDAWKDDLAGTVHQRMEDLLEEFRQQSDVERRQPTSGSIPVASLGSTVSDGSHSGPVEDVGMIWSGDLLTSQGTSHEALPVVTLPKKAIQHDEGGIGNPKPAGFPLRRTYSPVEEIGTRQKVTTEILIAPQQIDQGPALVTIEELFAQAFELQEALQTGWTSSGRRWSETFWSLLGEQRIREFLRLPSNWIAGLRDILIESDPWIGAGLEDCIRYLYPAGRRSMDLRFRLEDREGAGNARPGFDWTALRLLALVLTEVASSDERVPLSPSALMVLLRWQVVVPQLREGRSSPLWWSWIAAEVDQRLEQLQGQPFVRLTWPDSPRWRQERIGRFLAIPRPELRRIGVWASQPWNSLSTEPQPDIAKWSSRLSMLQQIVEEAKEDSLRDLLRESR